jgi:hypothetical protein
MKCTFNSPGRLYYKDGLRDVQMSNKKEHPQRYGWWISELSSLGIKRMGRNDMSDRKEITDLTENIKQTLFQEYKTVYSQ